MNSWLPLIIFIISVILGWRSPRVGVWLVVFAIPTYVIKLNIGPIPTTVVEVMLWGMFIGWLIPSPLARLKALVKTYSPLTIPLILILVGLVIGTIVSTDLRLSLGIVKGWFVSPILLYGMTLVMFERKQISSLVNALMLSALALSIVALYQVATGNFITVDHRASAWLASANYLSLYLVPILLVSTYWLLNSKSRLYQIWFWISFVLGALAVFFSFSYGGWLALIVGGLVLGIWQFRHRWQFWVGGGAIALIAAATQITSERVERMINIATQSSVSVRLQVWATDLLMAKEKWLTGIGLGQYPARYPEFVTRLYPKPLEAGMLHAHNLYLQFLLNLGIAGLAGFVWLVVKFFVFLKNCPASWAIPLTAAMVAILVHGLVDTPYWKNDLSYLFWIILALAAVNSRTKTFAQ